MGLIHFKFSCKLKHKAQVVTVYIVTKCNVVLLSHPLSHRQSVDWLGEAYHSFRNGVLVACAFSLGVVLPLSVVSAALPPYHSGSGLGCSDFLWSTVRQILQPYCSVQHSSMPPW